MGIVLPPYQCDFIQSDGTECPNTFYTDQGGGYQMITQVTNPGSPLAGFNCPNGLHYYCSWDHAQQGNSQCITNHLLPKRAQEVSDYNTTHPSNPIS
jgi:hypothetical protein